MDTGDSSTVRNTQCSCIGCQPHHAAYLALTTPPPIDLTLCGPPRALHICGAPTDKQAYTHQTP